MVKPKADGVFKVKKGRGQTGVGADSYQLDVLSGAYPTGNILTAKKTEVEKFKEDFWVKVVDGKVTKAGKTRKDL